MNDETVSIVKGGETIVEFTLSRTYVGTRLRVKAHSIVEDFFHQLVDPDNPHVDVRAHGRYWEPVNSFGKVDKSSKLIAYSMIIPGELGDSSGLSLGLLGGPLSGGLLEDIRGNDLTPAQPSIGSTYRPFREDYINISFLRLVGISEGNGVTFGIKGIHTEPMLRKLKDQLYDEIKKFYVKFMKPIDLTVTMVVQEKRG